VTFELVQDGAGGHTFNWPANSFAGGALNLGPNTTTVQEFLWDGTTLQAVGPAMGGGVFFAAGVVSPTMILGLGTSFFQLSNDAGTGENTLIEAGFSPGIGTGWGTGASVVVHNGTAAIRVNVGTGGTASTGTITFLKAATTGWNCSATDITNPGGNLTRQSGSTTNSVSFTNYNTSGVATAWPASDVLSILCFAL